MATAPIEVQNHANGDLGFAAAEIKALEAQMLGLNAILKAAPGVATPMGYSVETSGVVTSTDVVPGQPNPRMLPLPSSLMFGAFGITEFMRGGKTVRDDGGETRFLIFRINRMPAGAAVPDFIDLESDVMLEPPRGADVNGMPRYGDQLVLQKQAVPLFNAGDARRGAAIDRADARTPGQRRTCRAQHMDPGARRMARSEAAGETHGRLHAVGDPGERPHHRHEDDRLREDARGRVGATRPVVLPPTGPPSGRRSPTSSRRRPLAACRSCARTGRSTTRRCRAPLPNCS